MKMRATPDLIAAVLRKSGELTDGTSSYAVDALDYLNSVYRGVLSGGNEFGIDVDDPWAWALAPRPLVLTLNPTFEKNVALTINQRTGTFAAAPTTSMVGRVLKLEDEYDYYVIRAHTAGATTFVLDQPYPGATGTYAAQAIQLDYDLVDDTVIVDDTNKYIDFKEGATEFTAILDVGVYTPISFAAHVSSMMMDAGALIYDHEWNSHTRTFNWVSSAEFQFLFATGTNASVSAHKLMGMDIEDYSGSDEYTSVYSLNAINRIVGPMQYYSRSGFVNTASTEHGKIFEIGYNSFIRDEPLTNLSLRYPDRYCVVKHDTNGIVTVRFNGYVDETVRVEVPYIPIHPDLTDSVLSVPVIPIPFREFLVHGAAFYLLNDKSDDKADKEAALAKAKLLALQNHNRKQLHSSGINYARVIPRAGG